MFYSVRLRVRFPLISLFPMFDVRTKNKFSLREESALNSCLRDFCRRHFLIFQREGTLIKISSVIPLSDISKEMAIDSYDIVSTLQALGMMKYWKGKHIILKKQVGALLLF